MDKHLDELMKFTIGKNQTRITDFQQGLYTPDDFEQDLHSVSQFVETKKCVINLIRSKAAPLSEKTKEKCLTSNFLKCSFDTNILDPWFFCYQFNESKTVEEQISRLHQGNTLCVKKLTMRSVSEIKIPLYDIKKQRMIGKIYRQMIIHKDLMLHQAENMENLTLAIIKKIEED
ncbi:MAG: hypothetical protein U0O05_05150 [Dorea phocaeensis]|jgi:hypothetical protein